MTKHLISKATQASMPAQRSQHQFNENAVRHSKSLATAAGMERIGIHLVRIEPGRESTSHHYHDADEEFIYIIEGSGVARIGKDEHVIGAGDFMGFPAPSPAHSLRNTSDQDLVYLMGGEKWPTDIVHYPDQQRSMIKAHGRRAWMHWDNISELPAK